MLLTAGPGFGMVLFVQGLHLEDQFTVFSEVVGLSSHRDACRELSVIKLAWPSRQSMLKSLTSLRIASAILHLEEKEKIVRANGLWEYSRDRLPSIWPDPKER